MVKLESGRNIIMGIENLYTSFYTKEGEVKAVNGINLSLYEKSILGGVGESGSGKSATALSIMRLLPEPGVIKSGSVHFEKLNVLELNYEELRQVRGKDMAMIFQEPLSALNPLVNIETHMQEVLQAHSSMSKRDAKDISLQLLAEFDIPSPSETLKLYPFQLSGGQIQRVMIAMSMAWQPRMLIADEITSNLDVTLQADVLDRLRRLISEKQSSIVLITHDMGVIAQLAEFVAVMYAGSIVEYSSTIDLFNKPYHPYTDALLQTIPRLDQPDRNLQQIPGSPPDLIDLPDQCPYLSRCSKATNQCRLEPRPLLREIRPGHFVACYNELQ